MSSKTVQEIERAIESLTHEELGELYAWLDEQAHPTDLRIQADLAAGRLDRAILNAIRDEENDQVQPL